MWFNDLDLFMFPCHRKIYIEIYKTRCLIINNVYYICMIILGKENIIMLVHSDNFSDIINNLQFERNMK